VGSLVGVRWWVICEMCDFVRLLLVDCSGVNCFYLGVGGWGGVVVCSVCCDGGLGFVGEWFRCWCVGVLVWGVEVVRLGFFWVEV